MAEGISPREFLNDRRMEEKKKESESGPRRALLRSGTTIYFKDKGKFVHKNVPKGTELEVSFIKKREGEAPQFETIVEGHGEEGKEGEEKRKRICTLMEIHGRSTEGEYRKDLTKLQFERKNSPVVELGAKLWCDLKDLEERLKPKEEKKTEEKNEEEIPTRDVPVEDVIEMNKRIANNWPKEDKSTPPYKDEYEDGDNDH